MSKVIRQLYENFIGYNYLKMVVVDNNGYLVFGSIAKGDLSIRKYLERERKKSK